MIFADSPLAIPLWINGHAFLTMAPAFRDVRNPASGHVLRRTPLCGIDEAKAAVVAAQAALVSWQQLTEDGRVELIAALATALSALVDHFAALIAEETGKDPMVARAEVIASVDFLQKPESAEVSGVCGVIGDAGFPLFSGLKPAFSALTAGAVVVVKPDPTAPSALYALAELTGRCRFPPGVFNILHGDDAAVAGLHSVLGADCLCL